MRWIALTAAAAAVLAVGAAPAFTAESGSVAVTVTAEPPPAPCLTVAPGTLDFGTLPFTKPAALSGRNFGVDLTNCGTADENLTVVGTDAAGASGSWALSSGGLPCDLGVDKYTLLLSKYEPGDADYRIYTPITKIAATVANPAGTPFVFPAGTPTTARLGLLMPCQGSNGAGEAKTLSVTFTAIVA